MIANMALKRLRVLSPLIIFFACTPKVDVTRSASFAALPISVEVYVFGDQDILPANSTFVGTVSLGDTGLSVGCGLDQIMELGKKKARQLGGNALKWVRYFPPDSYSTCHRASFQVFRLPEKKYIDSKEIHTGYSEYALKKEWSEQGIDMIEGIFQSVVSSSDGPKYKLAIKKHNSEEYRLIYISGALGKFRHQWREGDLKGTIRKTATSSIFTVDWVMADKSINSDVHMSVSAGTAKFFGILPSQEELYLKLYPTNESVLPSFSTDITSSGTGFAINNEGYVVTNDHVISSSKFIYLRGVNKSFNDLLKVEVVLRDPKNDIALLKIEESMPNSSKKIPFGFNFSLRDMGEKVFALGYPLRSTMGEEIKLTDGIISSLSGFQDDITNYQVSVPVQPGNSGGPLFDRNGNVTGIVTAKHMGTENVSYAVKASYLKNMIENSGLSITINQRNSISYKSFSEQVKLIKEFVFIVEGRNTLILEKENVAAKKKNKNKNEEVGEVASEKSSSNKAPSKDRVKREEEVSYKLTSLNRGLKSDFNHGVNSLDEKRIEAISLFFNIPQDEIKHFRWGESFAPQSSIRYDTIFYAVRFKDANKSGTSTLYIDSTGEIVDKKVD